MVKDNFLFFDIKLSVTSNDSPQSIALIKRQRLGFIDEQTGMATLRIAIVAFVVVQKDTRKN